MNDANHIKVNVKNQNGSKNPVPKKEFTPNWFDWGECLEKPPSNGIQFS